MLCLFVVAFKYSSDVNMSLIQTVIAPFLLHLMAGRKNSRMHCVLILVGSQYSIIVSIIYICMCSYGRRIFGDNLLLSKHLSKILTYHLLACLFTIGTLEWHLAQIYWQPNYVKLCGEVNNLWNLANHWQSKVLRAYKICTLHIYFRINYFISGTRANSFIFKTKLLQYSMLMFMCGLVLADDILWWTFFPLP